MAASDSNNLSNLQKLTATLIISSVLTACGGGGGGSDSPADDDRGAGGETLTELPAFLESARLDCWLLADSERISLMNFRGDWEQVTELHCYTTVIENLNGINLLTGLSRLELVDVGLIDTNGLEALSTHLEILNLSENPLSSLAAIGQLNSLTMLDLSGTGAVDINSLGGLQSLRDLNLAKNDIIDPLALSEMTGLRQVNLTGNDSLLCENVRALEGALETEESGYIVLPPAHCAKALTVGNDSPNTILIDNSLESPAYDRIDFGMHGLSNMSLRKSAEDFSVLLETRDAEKVITFQNWFSHRSYQLGIFAVYDLGEVTFDELRSNLAMEETLGVGDEVYQGGDYADIVYGNSGLDVLMGGAGSDTLSGGIDNDVLVGNRAEIDAENNVLAAHLDDVENTYIFNPGDGHDFIIDYSKRGGLLIFGEGIDVDMITLSRSGDNLTFHISESESVEIYNWYKGRDYQLDQIQFADEPPVSAIELVSTLAVIGGEDGEEILGSDEADIIDGAGGDDIIYGLYGADILFGGHGVDRILGGDSSDTLNGGPGNDYLVGYDAVIDDDGTVTKYSSSSADSQDTYLFNLDDDNDVIIDWNLDYIERGGLLKFGPGIDADSITLSRVGNDLTFHVNEFDSVTVYRWFIGWEFQLTQIQFDGFDPVSAPGFVEARLP